MTVYAESEKRLKKQKLRNFEYYEMQDVFDRLHAQAKQGRKFSSLLRIISSKDNILLAYRNIKNNAGSMTKGTDGRTIEHYKGWTEEKFVRHFQGKFSNYHPKSVRRVEIPKVGQPHKTRPLGIPCMDDRIVQQCILQVLEPIGEAHFHKHSYGFRPNRATSHAIARANFLIKQSRMHFVVDIDIKGFFDNVNHGKLLKQMWTLGIQDKKLLAIVSKILKSEIKGIGIPSKGTPQGGIISPLLSNVVLNELDWWLSGQWETFQPEYKYAGMYKYQALRKRRLKEFFFVRYADDFKIFCRDYQTAQKIFAATQGWLKERLGLEISPEKSKITNIRKAKTEFLGLALFVKPKGGEYVTRSSIQNEAKKAMKHKIKEQIKAIQREPTPQQVNKLNAMILGMHNYYRMASLCSLDFDKIDFIVSKSLYNRLKDRTLKVVRGRPPDQGPKTSKTYKKFYGKYGGRPKIIAGVHIFPVYGCTFKVPMNFTPEINNFTETGRKLIHSRLRTAQHLVKYLLENKEANVSVELNDNRISLIAGQYGRCGVTGQALEPHNMQCHHKRPKALGGDDSYKNLLWVCSDVHKLIHATRPEIIAKYMNRLDLDDKALKKVNSLRLLAESSEIESKT